VVFKIEGVGEERKRIKKGKGKERHKSRIRRRGGG